ESDDPQKNLPAEEAFPVSIMQVRPTNVPILAETVAQTEGAKETEIRPRVGGILLKRLYHEGAPVAAGQPLFKIDPVPFENALAEAQAQYQEQRVRVERTRREEHRMQQLIAKNFVSQRAYDAAVADHAVEKAALMSAKTRVERAELNLSYTKVTAPVAGVSGRSQFSEGALVSANTSLLTTIVQLSPIWVRFSFSDNELRRFGGQLTEQNVRHVTLILADGAEYPHQGKVNFAASQIDPSLGTQQLRATFENTDQQLLPGQFVRVRVAAAESRQLFVLPQVAVLTSDQGRYVYLVDENSKTTKRSIETGDWIDNDWVIMKGLNSGDRVIVDNIIKLRPEIAVKPKLSQASLPNQ
ncbi:MAG: efflux RND transporter periplasmic adaptor subunit, partial [Nitrosomonas sp.]|nr:efflux RND transporter periplasmic adaptor subunit [Nitrosomonas sp.]